MGLSSPQPVIERFRKIAINRHKADAFFDVMSEQEEAAKKTADKRNLNIVRALPLDLPPVGMVCVDVNTLLYSIMPSGDAATGLVRHSQRGSSIADRASGIMSALVREHQPEKLVACFDIAKHVPSAKRIAQADRRVKSRGERYVDFVTLSNGTRAPLDSYRYALDACVPNSFDSVRKTPDLLRRAVEFTGEALAAQFRAVNMELFVSTEARIFSKKTAVDPLAEARTISLPPLEVGEAEHQCLHWLMHYYARGEEQAVRPGVVVRANDSDAICILLLAVPRVLAVRKDAFVLCDYTAPRCTPRYVDVVKLWHAIQEYSMRSLSRPMRQHCAVETLIAAALFGGCDFTFKIERVGAVKYVDRLLGRPETMAAPDDEHPSSLCISSRNRFGSRKFIYSETRWLTFVFKVLKNVKAIGELYAKNATVIENRSSIAHMFDTLAELVFERNLEILNASKAQERVSGKPFHASKFLPPVPTGAQARARVRRVMWTLYYMRNGYLGGSGRGFPDPLAQLDGESVYGYELDPADERGRRVRVANSVCSNFGPFVKLANGSQRSVQLGVQLTHESDRFTNSSSCVNSAMATDEQQREQLAKQVWEKSSNSGNVPFDSPTANELQFAVSDANGTYLPSPDLRHILSVLND